MIDESLVEQRQEEDSYDDDDDDETVLTETCFMHKNRQALELSCRGVLAKLQQTGYRTSNDHKAYFSLVPV